MRRRTLIVAGFILLGLPLGLVVLGLGVANTGWGRDRLAAAIGWASTGQPVRVAVGAIEGVVPTAMVLRDVTLSDVDGMFAHVGRAQIDWRPLRLLSGALQVDRVAIEAARLERAPTIPSTTPDSAANLAPIRLSVPAPPLTMSIEAVAVQDVRLGAALLGEEVVLAAELRTLWTADTAALAGWVDARRVAGGSARLDVDLSIDPRNEVLRADVRAHEPEGGLLAGLAGLPERPAFDLTLGGAGTLAAWKGRLQAGFGVGARLALALDLSTDSGGYLLRLDGDVEPTRLLPSDVASAIGPSVPVSLIARLLPSGAIEFRELKASAAAGDLRGAVTVDPDGIPVAADLSVRLPSLSALSSAADLELDGSLDITARLTEQGQRLQLSVTGAATANGTGLSSVGLDVIAMAFEPLALLPDTIDVTVSGGADTPELPDIDLATMLGPRLRFEGDGKVMLKSLDASIDRLSLASEGLTLDATGTLSDTRRLDLAVDATVSDLTRWRSIVGQAITGGVVGNVDVSLHLDPLDLSAVIDLSAVGVDLGDPDVSRLIGREPGLGAGITMDADGNIAVHELWASLALADIEGDLSLATATGAFDGRATLRLPDLAPLGPMAGVELEGQGTVALAIGGVLGAPTASASWRFGDLSVEDVAIARVEGTATVIGLPGTPEGRVSATAWIEDSAVTVTTSYALAGDRVRLDGLTIDGAGVTAAGDLVLDARDTTAAGALSLMIADLGVLGSIFDLPMTAGALRLDLALNAADGQSAQVEGQMEGVRFSDGRTVESLRLSGEGRDLLGMPSGRLEVNIGTFRPAAGIQFDGVIVAIDADGTNARVTVVGEGAAGMQPIHVDAAAAVGLTADPPTVTVSRLDARLGAVDLAIDRPLLIGLGPKPMLRDLSLVLDGGRVTGSGRLDPADLDVRLTARGIPAALVRAIDPSVLLSGVVDADLRATGRLDDPSATVTISTDGIRIDDPEYAEAPPLTATLSARLDALRLTIQGEAAIAHGVQASARAELTLAGPPGAIPTPAMDAAMTARLDANADVAHLIAFLPLDAARVSGRFTAGVTASGTPNDPVLDGSVVLTEGAVDLPNVGLYLRDLALDARGRGDRLWIDSLTARALAGGTIEGGGWFSFNTSQGMPADIRLTARDFVAVSTDEATIVLDSDLALTGARPEYTVTGAVTMKPSEIRIPNSLPTTVVILDVIEVNGPEDAAQKPEPPSAGTGAAPLVLDLTVAIPGQVFVRGRGLDSEWQGELTVTGPVDAPEVRGAIRVRRGSLDALGRLFAFERGQVSFDGGAPDNPNLDMRLTTDVAGIVAAVIVSGSAQEPTVELDSTPALAEEEILSRILFGEPKAGLSPFQALRLAQSTAVMAGRLDGDGGLGGIQDTVRRTLGADTLSVENETRADGTTGSSLSVGKYVAPGVFFKLQQGLSGDNSRAVVEVDVTDHVKVETDMGADSQSRVGANFKLDY
ncbi:MAG: translocation/assembly module TamB domain-containing protein [Alphaproteobacteria bacterium]|nr:translocation/assembly module TamB domain-containing protein [Alphaproteobacteria bacterium]